MSLKIPKMDSLYKQNLLANGDFQINQRGQSVYLFGYSCDMWFNNTDTALGWTKDGIVFKNIWQKIMILKNSNYTFSYKIHNSSVQKNIQINSLNKEFNDENLKVILETDGDYTKVRIIKMTGKEELRISYVQLVEGIACKHQKEDYLIMLEKCRKYYREETIVYNKYISNQGYGYFKTSLTNIVTDMIGNPTIGYVDSDKKGKADLAFVGYVEILPASTIGDVIIINDNLNTKNSSIATQELFFDSSPL